MFEHKHPQRFPQRKSPRIPNFDYSAPNYYFVTVCTKEKRCLFGLPDQRNLFGQIAETGLRQIPEHFPGVQLDKYVVMPNHIHAIIVLTESCADLSTIIGQYKSYVSKAIHKSHPELAIWQTSFHDHIIRNPYSYEKIWLYIESNPIKWKEDCFFVE